MSYINSKQQHFLVARTLVTTRGVVAIAMLANAALVAGQQEKSAPPRITASETAALLKQDPTLTSGFKTPSGATARVAKPIKGGVAVHFSRNDGVEGDLTVVGPPTVMTRSFYEFVIDTAIKLGLKTGDKKQGGKCNLDLGSNNVIIGGVTNICAN